MLQTALAADLRDLRLVHHAHPVAVLQRVAEVLRHALGERGSSHHDGDAPRIAQQMHGGLARRVAAADDVDVLGREGLRLRERCPVEDPGPSKRSRPGISRRRYSTPVASTTARAVTSSPSSISTTWRSPSVRSALTSRMRRNSVAEHPGLLVCALRQLRAAHAAREAQVVADQGAGAGLPADRLALDHEGAQPLGGGGHRGREARWAGAYHDHVEIRAPLDCVVTPKASATSLLSGSWNDRPSSIRTSGPGTPRGRPPRRSWRPRTESLA